LAASYLFGGLKGEVAIIFGRQPAHARGFADAAPCGEAGGRTDRMHKNRAGAGIAPSASLSKFELLSGSNTEGVAPSIALFLTVRYNRVRRLRPH
jgi:hypothetical protein